jgi:hypothetical protein
MSQNALPITVTTGASFPREFPVIGHFSESSCATVRAKVRFVLVSTQQRACDMNEAVNAMLLNEFLKERREVQELKKQVEALTMGLQKVSAQLAGSKPAPQVVLNNH